MIGQFRTIAALTLTNLHHPFLVLRSGQSELLGRGVAPLLWPEVAQVVFWRRDIEQPEVYLRQRWPAIKYGYLFRHRNGKHHCYHQHDFRRYFQRWKAKKNAKDAQQSPDGLSDL